MSHNRVFGRINNITYVIFPDGGVCVGVCGEKRYARPGLFSKYQVLETAKWKDDIYDLYIDNHDDYHLRFMERDERDAITTRRVNAIIDVVKRNLMSRY